MNKTTFYIKILLTTFLLLLGCVGWTQTASCVVYDDLTVCGREFLANKSLSSQTTLSVPANYTIILLKKLEFTFGQNGTFVRSSCGL